MFGNFLTACTIAYPSTWVKEILPPRVRLRWLLITMRLSIISLAGIARTLVAVGTSSEANMFLTTAAAAPRSTCASSTSAFGVDGLASASLGLAGVTSVLAAGGCVTAGGACLLAGAGSAFGWAGSALAGACSALAGAPLPVAAFGAGAGPGSRGADGADARPPPPSFDVPAVDSGE